MVAVGPAPPTQGLLQQVCEYGLGGGDPQATEQCSLAHDDGYPQKITILCLLGSRSYSRVGTLKSVQHGLDFPPARALTAEAGFHFWFCDDQREGWEFSFIEISKSHREPSSLGNLFNLSAVKQCYYTNITVLILLLFPFYPKIFT